MRRRHATCAAWTGLIAIWLAIVAPIVTQWLASQEEAGATFTATLCSARPLDARNSPDRATSSPPSHHAKSCGYCNLLAHHPPLTHAIWADWAVLHADVPRAHRAASTVRVSVRFALACPRGPPHMVS
ncbi:DUF2946 domain-containing protein [Trinickia fusca]|nr:DUF2946 domain-containing protein [Trinickia fusca]